jgi:hypothetical protein
MDDNWSIQELWNELLTEDYPIKPRGHIRASELGKPYLDRYLAMKGVTPTNPFPARIKRVFDVGYIFEEDVVARIFRLLNILHDQQETVRVKRKGLLEVIGHYDYKVGGTVSLQKVKENVWTQEVSSWMKTRTLKLAEELEKKYPNGMRTLIGECKSVNSRAFWSHKNTDPNTGFFKGYPHHKLQLLTYLLGTGQDEGRLFYVSKDDMTIFETSVFQKPNILAEWEDDVATMSDYIMKDREPDKEPNIVFNKEKGVYEINWKVANSQYFTLITGEQNQEAWEGKLRLELKEKNKGKCKQCEKEYQLITLNANDGFCGRCSKKQLEQTTVVLA